MNQTPHHPIAYILPFLALIACAVASWFIWSWYIFNLGLLIIGALAVGVVLSIVLGITEVIYRIRKRDLELEKEKAKINLLMARADRERVVVNGDVIVTINNVNHAINYRQAPQLPAPIEEAPKLLPAPQLDIISQFIAAIHLMFIGFSGGGKTTLLHHLATQLAKAARVLVVDADAGNGQWPGCEVFGDENIPQALKLLETEFNHRVELRRNGQQVHFDPLWLIIDEYAATAKDLRGMVEKYLRRGRKYNLHVAIGIQDKQVKSLGWEGNGELRSNITYMVEARKNAQTGERFMVITPNEGDTFTLSTPLLPDVERFITPVRRDENRENWFDTSTLKTTQTEPPLPENWEAIAAHLQAGKSANAWHTQVGGTRQTVLAEVATVKKYLEGA
jgi:hypothetical protein